MQLNRRRNALVTVFGNWTRSVAMWLIWNVPCGNLAPVLLGYALRAKPNKIESSNLKEPSNKLNQQ